MQIFTMLVARTQNAWFQARDKESGQTLVEYALIISLIALACVAALGFLSGRIQTCSPRRVTHSRPRNRMNTAGSRPRTGRSAS